MTSIRSEFRRAYRWARVVRRGQNELPARASPPPPFDFRPDMAALAFASASVGRRWGSHRALGGVFVYRLPLAEMLREGMTVRARMAYVRTMRAVRLARVA